uniref:Uncharacterized protein n=1 Tax=Alexandrium monilatum TaxID=311494 RepID=A0A6T1ED67_9DINO
MVLARVHFRLAGRHWTREFSADDGTSVQQLKGLMVKSEKEEDLDAFELRRDRKRLSDSHLLWEDCHLDFKFLGVERGRLRAGRDAAEAEASKAVGANPSAVTLESVLALQADLMAGFGRPAFQKQLDALEEKFKDNQRKFQAERQKLFLTVQRVVLPKWGFAGTAKGVFEMMGALQNPKFNVDYNFQVNGWRLAGLLRLGPSSFPAGVTSLAAQSWSLLKDLADRMSSSEYQGTLQVLAQRLGSDKPDFYAARDAMAFIVHTDVLPTYGWKQSHEPSDAGIAKAWATINSFGGDEEVTKMRRRVEELLRSDGRGGRDAAACGPWVGTWSASSSPLVYTIAQVRDRVVALNAEEAWSPARGVVDREKRILLEWPEAVRGFAGQLVDDVIHWVDRSTWHRHVETDVTVQSCPGVEGGEMQLRTPAGATVAWVREELSRRLQQQDLQLACMDGPDEPLSDELVILPQLNKFNRLRVLPRGETAPSEEQPEKLDEAPAPTGETAGREAPQDERPGTPRTGSQMFDFHDLPDDY